MVSIESRVSKWSKVLSVQPNMGHLYQTLLPGSERSRRKRWKECKNRMMGECCEPGTLSWTHYHCGYLYKIKTAATVSIPASDPILTGLRGLQIESHTPPPPQKKKGKEERVCWGGCWEEWREKLEGMIKIHCFMYDIVKE